MNGPARIVVGGFELLTSGSTLSYGYQPVDIYPVDTSYHVRLMYESAADKPPSISIDQSVLHQTKINAVNFNYNTGLASGAPLYVANWNGRKLYLIFSCHLMGDASATTGVRQTTFSFYLGEAV